MTNEHPRASRVAIVGAGIIGRIHAEAIASLSALELVAIVDPVRESAVALQQSATADTGKTPSVWGDLASALDGADIDIVVISTPTGYHAANAVMAIEAGKHVLIEKPLDVTPESAAAVVHSAHAHPEVIAAVISQKRFEISSERVHSAIARGDLGRITSAVVTGALWRSQGYYDMGEWRGTWKLDGGGALMNQGVHSVDLLLWFLGRPRRILAKVGLLAHSNIEVEDTAVAVIEFESGALATVHYSTAAYPGTLPRIGVYGDAGTAVIDSDDLVFYHSASSGVDVGDFGLAPGGNQVESSFPPSAGDESFPAGIEGHRRQYLDLLAAIEGAHAPRVGVDDAYMSLATIGAIYQAARTGLEVDFDAYANLLPSQ